MALSRVISEIFNVEKYRDLEISVKGQSFDGLDVLLLGFHSNFVLSKMM